MKVLFPIHWAVNAAPTNHVQSLRDAKALCKNMGYELDVRVIEDASTEIASLDTTDYAFTVITRHRHESGMNTPDALFDIFDLDIPVLIAGVQNDNALSVDAWTGSTINSASAYKKINWLSPVMNIYMWSMDYEIVSGQEANVTILANDEATGRMVFWRYDNPAKSAPVYCFGGDPSTGLHLPLPVLINQAILDGNIAGDKLPPKKLTSMFDIDDFPNSLNIELDMQNVIDVQNTYRWPMTWGIQLGNSGQPGGNDIWDTTVTAAMKQLMIDNAPANGGYLYASTHNHNFHWNMSDSPVDTKAEMDAEYRIDAARAIADGVPLGYNADGIDGYGYNIPTNNRVSDEMFQLGSPQTNNISSPLNGTVQAGYGWSAVRVFSDSQADGYGYSNNAHGIRYHRGMVLLNGSFAILDSEKTLTPDSALELNRFSNVFAKWFTDCMGYDAVHFFHGNNLLDAHDAGNAPALKVMELIGTWANWLSPIHEFVHPKTHVDRLNITVGDNIEL